MDIDEGTSQARPAAIDDSKGQKRDPSPFIRNVASSRYSGSESMQTLKALKRHISRATPAPEPQASSTGAVPEAAQGPVQGAVPAAVQGAVAQVAAAAAAAQPLAEPALAPVPAAAPAAGHVRAVPEGVEDVSIKKTTEPSRFRQNLRRPARCAEVDVVAAPPGSATRQMQQLAQVPTACPETADASAPIPSSPWAPPTEEVPTGSEPERPLEERQGRAQQEGSSPSKCLMLPGEGERRLALLEEAIHKSRALLRQDEPPHLRLAEDTHQLQRKEVDRLLAEEQTATQALPLEGGPATTKEQLEQELEICRRCILGLRKIHHSGEPYHGLVDWLRTVHKDVDEALP